MNCGITRWKEDPLNPKPFSPVQRHLKFSAVLGTTSGRNSITTRPTSSLFAVISKNTFGNVVEASEANVLSTDRPKNPMLLPLALE